MRYYQDYHQGEEEDEDSKSNVEDHEDDPD
jgi:hypothetical protein